MSGTTEDDARSRRVEDVLGRLVAAAREALGDLLCAMVLFGSAAEGRLRATSDVNLIFVLRRFEPSSVDPLREPLRTAQAAVHLTPMFLLQEEIALASELFADKFADVQRRRRVLYGVDPFAGIAPSRPAEIARLRQILLNLELRLRQRYALGSLRSDQAALAVADAAGPLRSAAASLLELRGRAAPHPKEALVQLVAELGNAEIAEAVELLSVAREKRVLPAGKAAPALAQLIELAHTMREQVSRLEPEQSK